MNFYPKRIINDLFPNLANDYGTPNRAFKPYTYKTTKALEWAKSNWLPIALFAAGIAIA